jgi:hypothetical protein
VSRKSGPHGGWQGRAAKKILFLLYLEVATRRNINVRRNGVFSGVRLPEAKGGFAANRTAFIR